MKKILQIPAMAAIAIGCAAPPEPAPEPAPLAGTTWHCGDRFGDWLYEGPNYIRLHFEDRTRYNVQLVRNGTVAGAKRGAYTLAGATDVELADGTDVGPARTDDGTPRAERLRIRADAPRTMDRLDAAGEPLKGPYTSFEKRWPPENQ